MLTFFLTAVYDDPGSVLAPSQSQNAASKFLVRIKITFPESHLPPCELKCVVFKSEPLLWGTALVPVARHLQVFLNVDHCLPYQANKQLLLYVALSGPVMLLLADQISQLNLLVECILKSLFNQPSLR
jgi:hypothetical protein